MTAPRNSILVVLLLFSCSCSGEKDNVVIKNHIAGCFTLTDLRLDTGSDPVLLHANVGSGKLKGDCPCTSAHFKYSAYQESGDGTNSLMSGYFTTLQKKTVILPVSAYDTWLDPAERNPDQLDGLLTPYPAAEMTAVPVSTLVNNPKNDVPECVAPQQTLF